MKRYKIGHTEVQPPPEEVTDKHKDFERLKANYQDTLERIHKRPLYRDPKMLLAVVAALLVAWLLIRQAMETDEQQPEQIEQTDEN